jgi:hypothetical protein
MKVFEILDCNYITQYVTDKVRVKIDRWSFIYLFFLIETMR